MEHTSVEEALEQTRRLVERVTQPFRDGYEIKDILVTLLRNDLVILESLHVTAPAFAAGSGDEEVES